MIGEVSRNVIKAGESDVATFSVIIPYWAKSPWLLQRHCAIVS